MINFYRRQNCVFSDDVVETLQQLVVAHKVYWVEEQGTLVPRLVEGKKEYTNPKAIYSFLASLKKELVIQREMQSDSCKIDPDNGAECL